MPSPDPVQPVPHDWPSKSSLVWRGVALVLAAAAAVWASDFVFGRPRITGEMVGGRGCVVTCRVGGDDGRPVFRHLVPESGPESPDAALPVKPHDLVGQRVRCRLVVTDTGDAPGVWPGAEVTVTGTVVGVSPERLDLTDGVVNKVEPSGAIR